MFIIPLHNVLQVFVQMIVSAHREIQAMVASLLTGMDFVNTCAHRNSPDFAIVEKVPITQQEILSIALDAQVIACTRYPSLAI